jgi:hypothetical protein
MVRADRGRSFGARNSAVGARSHLADRVGDQSHRARCDPGDGWGRSRDIFRRSLVGSAPAAIRVADDAVEPDASRDASCGVRVAAIPRDRAGRGMSGSRPANPRRRLRRTVLLAAVTAAWALTFTATALSPSPAARIGHAGRWITDGSGRVVVVHGLNMVYKVRPYYPGPAQVRARRQARYRQADHCLEA